MITLTEKAIEKVKEFAESEGIEKLALRAKISGGGCSGYEFGLSFDTAPTDTDEVLIISGISLFIDELSFQYMEDITIDYLESPFGGGFQFRGGAIKASCACGSSVSF